MNHGHERQCAADFVALEVADEVPASYGWGKNRGRGRPGSLEYLRFMPKFLRAAFAEVVASRGDEFGRFARADVLGDAD
jgi:hypothetical protein